MAIAATAAAIVAGCGGSSGGPVTLNFVGPIDPGGTNTKAAAECSQQSGGRYRIRQLPVANSADATRELFVRRLAAGDKNMDIINMDTIYTPEFAEAGWLTELTGADKEDALEDVLPGPAESVTWEDKIYGVPLNTNVQLLWYRKDLVPRAPETWDEMIQMAKELPAGQGNILEQGNKYEGYVVWFNNLVSSAGGEIVDAEGRPVLDEAAVKAATIIRDVARSGRADPSLSTAQEDQARLAFEAGKGAFMLNWPYVYAAARADAETSEVTAEVFKNMGYARWPAVNKGEPSRVSIGGQNLGVPKSGRNPKLAMEAALCMTQQKWQAQEAINEGLPPVMNAVYDDPEVRKVYPFADLLREQLKDSVVRPPTPSYSDVTLAIQDSLHPPAAINPEQAINTLRDRLNTLADGGMY
ncbi:ABC transporter substrate-binding protein [Solirubrobacter sp. CPCC 204708]|uniref:ABC transporter substrate-binding protein n=1 Tax=Solirubrobacter deserti TaxID=2282478 RepID=A0ABT4RU59_9ACTN|nr:ABC transporter substrate-binding protein [Solirubrobacter deserti]MBE2316352.1 ABC transporter substrate-binding protein [Solirubrobacter deserti]MDA0142117.1 ABC transporter substrate-binding protein [Solirubrobacter deserti]